MTLGAAREQIADSIRRGEGMECPCCDRMNKGYIRHVSAAMAYFLARLLIVSRRNENNGWVHSREVMKGVTAFQWTNLSMNAHFFQYWALLEIGRGDNGGKPGEYRPTRKGAAWVHGKIKIPSFAVTYCGNKIGEADEKVTFREVLEREFSYREIMQQVYNPDFRFPRKRKKLKQ